MVISKGPHARFANKQSSKMALTNSVTIDKSEMNFYDFSREFIGPSKQQIQKLGTFAETTQPLINWPVTMFGLMVILNLELIQQERPVFSASDSGCITSSSLYGQSASTCLIKLLTHQQKP
eukprot:150818-Amphidinium_carterae.1